MRRSIHSVNKCFLPLPWQKLSCQIQNEVNTSVSQSSIGLTHADSFPTTAPLITSISVGVVRQQPPNKRAPAANQSCAGVPNSVTPVPGSQQLVAESQLSPLFG